MVLSGGLCYPHDAHIIVLYRIHSTFPPHDWQSSSGGPRPAEPSTVSLQLPAVSPQMIRAVAFSPARLGDGHVTPEFDLWHGRPRRWCGQNTRPGWPCHTGAPGLSPATNRPSKKLNPLPWGEGVERRWTGEGAFLNLESAILNRCQPSSGSSRITRHCFLSYFIPQTSYFFSSSPSGCSVVEVNRRQEIVWRREIFSQFISKRRRIHHAHRPFS